MTATNVLEEKKVFYVPQKLIYEELNGRKLYRRGYQNVLNKTKTIEETIGCSSLQGIIISILLRYLYAHTNENEYEIITNEIGLHVSLGNNLSSDIILYNAEEARQYAFDDHYFNVAPKMVIEVDVKIDLENTTAVDYLTEKNKTLFNFGVERIVWIFTEDKKIVLATPNKDWIVSDWSNDFTLLEGHLVNLEKMILKKGYKI